MAGAGGGRDVPPLGKPAEGAGARMPGGRACGPRGKAPRTGKMEEVAAAEGAGAPRLPPAGSPWPGPPRPRAAGRAAGMPLRRPWFLRPAQFQERAGSARQAEAPAPDSGRRKPGFEAGIRPSLPSHARLVPALPSASVSHTVELGLGPAGSSPGFRSASVLVPAVGTTCVPNLSAAGVFGLAGTPRLGGGRSGCRRVLKPRTRLSCLFPPNVEPRLAFLSVSMFGSVWSPCPVIFSLLCCRVANLGSKTALLLLASPAASPAASQLALRSPGEEKPPLVDEAPDSRCNFAFMCVFDAAVRRQSPRTGCQAVCGSGDKSEQPQLSLPSWVSQSVRT
ncbi:translation initiation factor IF-2-like [Zalophus californianus]|uniref:Translation initiation factor IF-2-like n=1 Tax=Zalophus californianus TaxID=9704 RepID=A0A6J2EKI2_ZALCA|nr:translation initiation factor IF-2-like [Zalophus californianus]